MNSSDIQSTDTIFTSSIGGGDIQETVSNKIEGLPANAKYASYELPIEVEDIGMPVYLSGIIQLITVVILLSKKKMYSASISFFTIGIFLSCLHVFNYEDIIFI